MEITVIIPYLNDPDLPETVRNIRETSCEQAHIRVVGDGVSVPPTVSNVDIDYLAVRRGVGPARHMGIHNAKSPWVLLTDAHVRFVPGWFQIASRAISCSGNTVLICGQCAGITDEQPDPEKSTQRYRGATMNIAGQDRQNRRKFELMQAIWNPGHPDPWEVLPAVMGACYLVDREWYLSTGGLDRLKTWGGDEETLSLNAWLSGREVRYLPSLLVGHKFNIGKPRRFGVPSWHPWYNRIAMLRTYADVCVAAEIERRMPRTNDIRIAQKNVDKDMTAIASYRTELRSKFTRDFEWYCKEFGLKIGI